MTQKAYQYIKFKREMDRLYLKRITERWLITASLGDDKVYVVSYWTDVLKHVECLRNVGYTSINLKIVWR